MSFNRILSMCRFLFLLPAILTIPATSQAKWLTIHNDFFQYDDKGQRIQTRSGCLIKFEDTYYWYGCKHMEFTNQFCYSSKDLLHWKNEGVMLVAPSGTNRMDVLYNEKTKKFVMILKWETPGTEWCNIGFATSNSPTGPFTKLSDSKVFGYNTGDMSVFKDDDGKAYYCFEQWIGENNMNQQLALMTDDYTGLVKSLQKWNVSNREAEMIMKNHGIYYYMTSDMDWIEPSATKYWTATDINGPWSTNLVSMLTPNDKVNKSWATQCDFVFPFKGTEDTLQMYCGDRWKTVDAYPGRNGDYLWLPMTFTPKDSVVVNYYQDWEVDPDRGIWREIDSKRNLALNKTATASSNSNTAGNVTSPFTYQNYANTKWVSASSDPQWISVDLGAAQQVNRVICKWSEGYAKSFKIQLSTDNTEWKDVYTTSVGAPISVTDETFASEDARYVRIYCTTRGEPSKGNEIFDVMVLNDSLTTDVNMSSGRTPGVGSPLMTYTNNAVQYTVTSDAHVKMDVIDGLGRLKAVIVDEFKSAGVYKTALPGSLASGRYIVRLTEGTKKTSTLQVAR
jgi:hypothetical protein